MREIKGLRITDSNFIVIITVSHPSQATLVCFSVTIQPLPPQEAFLDHIAWLSTAPLFSYSPWTSSVRALTKNPRA